LIRTQNSGVLSNEVIDYCVWVVLVCHDFIGLGYLTAVLNASVNVRKLCNNAPLKSVPTKAIPIVWSRYPTVALFDLAANHISPVSVNVAGARFI
jgi:hypothetical protein